MANDHKPAVLFLRMSPQLRETLREAADHAGCSLNAFAVQVLATAAGDPARFRVEVDTATDALGYPVRRKERSEHIGARTTFIGSMEAQFGSTEMVRLVKHYDAEDPGYFVEWLRRLNARPDVS
jgi:uncharacterized protein (DUF1778 family)